MILVAFFFAYLYIGGLAFGVALAILIACNVYAKAGC